MSRVTIDDSSLTSIANAIRSKLGVETTYLPSQMAGAIGSIETGGTDLTSADEGKVVVESSGDYVLQAQTSRSISQNGTYDTTTNDEVVVNVSGGGGESAVLTTKTITQNGTYNASSDNADGYSSVTVSVQGGASSYIETWDLTDSTVGQLHGTLPATVSVTVGDNGATFTSNSSRMRIPISPAEVTFEIDVVSMPFDATNNRRFLMVSANNGFIYRSTGEWGLYSGSDWVMSGETAADFFDGSTLKVIIDANGYWHFYKDGVLWWEPAVALKIAAGDIYIIGSGESKWSIMGAVISAIRIM